MSFYSSRSGLASEDSCSLFRPPLILQLPFSASFPASFASTTSFRSNFNFIFFFLSILLANCQWQQSSFSIYPPSTSRTFPRQRDTRRCWGSSSFTPGFSLASHLICTLAYILLLFPLPQIVISLILSRKAVSPVCLLCLFATTK